MRLFACQSCDAMVFFENRCCGNCGHELGFLPDTLDISALEPDGDAADLRRN